ncbi:MAG: DUF2490 domain-containing protein [Bacteroidetes bacterium]|nr:DUF2490 domain-containing protein [Bacteroidota bacterium]
MLIRHWLIFLLLIFPFVGFGQITWENQVWTSLSLEKKIINKTKAELTLESRWSADPLMAVRYFPNFAIQRKWTNLISTTVHYRYITSNKGLGYRESSHRLMFDAVLGKSIKKTDIALRFRAGKEDEIGVNDGLFSFTQFVFRQKLSVKHEFFKQKFTFSFERFENIIGNEVLYYQRRYVLSSEHKINKRNSISLFVMYQDLISTRRMNFGIGYELKLDK